MELHLKMELNLKTSYKEIVKIGLQLPHQHQHITSNHPTDRTLAIGGGACYPCSVCSSGEFFSVSRGAVRRRGDQGSHGCTRTSSIERDLVCGQVFGQSGLSSCENWYFWESAFRPQASRVSGEDLCQHCRRTPE